jgi:CDP-glycerol glycerophosphotransferase (TagB/SpsB family)
MSDFMTVCSERHKEFWVKSGANPDLIRVTGQPRFDIYLREREEVDSKAKDNRNLLYLSYDDVAYLPSDLGEAFEGNWKQLREDTERVLREFSKSWNVTVKMHPQQAVGENWLGPNVTIADRLDDTRALIMASDVVIGFQTTSLYEAAVAGKPVIYAAWGSTFENVKESLIRFDLLPEVVTRAESPADLRTLLGEIVNTTPIATRRALKIIEDELGPVDGHATERVLEFMTKYLQDAHPVFLPRIRITPVVSAFVNIGMYGLMRVAAKALAPSRMPQILLRYSIAVQRFREVLRIRNYQKL